MTGWFLVFLLKASAVLLIPFLALGWFQQIHPAFDSFSHFRQVACAVLLVVTVLLFLVAPVTWTAASLAALAISMALSYPYLPGLGPRKTANTENTLRVMQFNLRFNNADVGAMAEAILSDEADVVLMQELTPLNFEVLDLLKEPFPYQLECNSRSSGSVALVSRHPFAKPARQDCLRKLGFVHARLQVGDRQMTVAGFHSKWPWPDRQYHQIGALKETIESLKTPIILAGDFNAAPWSAVVRRVARLSGTSVVEGALLSWKPMFKDRRDIFPPLLSLDQIMASDEFIPVARRRVRDGGSDHLPVLTEFVWREDVQTN